MLDFPVLAQGLLSFFMEKLNYWSRGQGVRGARWDIFVLV